MSNSKHILLFTIVLFFTIFSSACVSNSHSKYAKNHYTKQEKELVAKSEKGKLIDKTTLDGCGWIILLSNGRQIQPINIDNFDIEPIDGQDVWVQFHVVDKVGTCMAGDIVELDSIIKDRPKDNE